MVGAVGANPGQAFVASASLRVIPPSAVVDNAVQRILNLGVPFVASAGNRGADPVPLTSCQQSPARVPGAITVGNSRIDDTANPSSSRGTCVDIYAPGTLIQSAGIANDADDDILTGTSMATPQVSGAIAVVLSLSNRQQIPCTTAQILRAISGPVQITAIDGIARPLLFLPQTFRLDGTCAAPLCIPQNPLLSEYGCNSIDDNCNGVVSETCSCPPPHMPYLCFAFLHTLLPILLGLLCRWANYRS